MKRHCRCDTSVLSQSSVLFVAVPRALKLIVFFLHEKYCSRSKLTVLYSAYRRDTTKNANRRMIISQMTLWTNLLVTFTKRSRIEKVQCKLRNLTITSHICVDPARNKRTNPTMKHKLQEDSEVAPDVTNLQ